MPILLICVNKNVNELKIAPPSKSKSKSKSESVSGASWSGSIMSYGRGWPLRCLQNCPDMWQARLDWGYQPGSRGQRLISHDVQVSIRHWFSFIYTPRLQLMLSLHWLQHKWLIEPFGQWQRLRVCVSRNKVWTRLAPNDGQIESPRRCKLPDGGHRRQSNSKSTLATYRQYTHSYYISSLRKLTAKLLLSVVCLLLLLWMFANMFQVRVHHTKTKNTISKRPAAVSGVVERVATEKGVKLV